MTPLMDVSDDCAGQSAKDTNRDITTTIGYTIPAPNGANIDMDDLALENPAYREARQVQVHDVRRAEECFSLDVHGFQYYKLPTIPGEGEVDFTNNDDPGIKDIHYKGMADWLKKIFRAKEVIIFNHIVRNDVSKPQKYNVNYRGPATRPHIDVSHANVWKGMDRDSDELEKILSSDKWQAINIWRPLKTIKRDALAVMDTRSVSPDDIVQNTHERDGGVLVETSYLASGLKPGEPDNNSKHKWYYMHEQQPDEVVVFTMFDARPGATSNGTPHTAVHIPGSEEEPARQSIEMRAFILY